MHYSIKKTLLSRLLACALLGSSGSLMAQANDHQEFEAVLDAPFRPADEQQGRTFTLHFSYPGKVQSVLWRLELLTPEGRVAQQWYGSEALREGPAQVYVQWQGRTRSTEVQDGIYTVRMQAVALDAGAVPARPTERDIGALLERHADTRKLQSWDIRVGGPILTEKPPQPKPGKPPVSSAVPAVGGLPYTVYYGNLHSQTNHSDGGGALATCNGAQQPQQGSAGGPAEAYAYAKAHGLDFLAATEHNHLYDGNDSTVNLNANPVTVKNLYQSGLQAAAAFNAPANNPNNNFLAIYGLEVGTIASNGHMNVFNTDKLLGWERNGANQLLADIETPRVAVSTPTPGNPNHMDYLLDYNNVYNLMQQNDWIGQFNHPDSSEQQFKGINVGGVPSFPFSSTTASRRQMALCEVVNSSAFSNLTDESGTTNSGYENECKILLRTGHRIAFTSNQDNHCANWGASSTNRTAVLIPTGTALTMSSFLDALKARRVFATRDKASQLMFTVNNHVMGEEFRNKFSDDIITMTVDFANTDGKQISKIEIFEGSTINESDYELNHAQSWSGEISTPTPPITLLASYVVNAANPPINHWVYKMPMPLQNYYEDTIAHFYYVKITPEDGKVLWSAPIWMSQEPGI